MVIAKAYAGYELVLSMYNSGILYKVELRGDFGKTISDFGNNRTIGLNMW